jgi:hypothetical protein
MEITLPPESLHRGHFPGGTVTNLLEEALKRMASLPQKKQDHLAATLLAEMDADEHWEATLASPKSLALLDDWAEEALRDLKEGRTEDLDPEEV